jgi:acetolactate synthase-1/2/3 large subunit
MTEKRQVERHEKPALAVGPHPMDAADLLVAYLEQIGVEYIFGVPGGAIEPLYNALARSARHGGPRAIVARHESGAAFMADGYARETGKIGVCCATSGPGLLAWPVPMKMKSRCWSFPASLPCF